MKLLVTHNTPTPHCEPMDEVDDPWLLLDTELNAWTSISRCATFWWRDDDAVAPGPALDRLLKISDVTGLLLAVIPERVEQALATRLAGSSQVYVAQHGYSHTNYAPRGQGLGAWELGLHRAEEVVLAEMDKGRCKLETMFGSAFLPVVVPPWNRIAPELQASLAAHGYRGISAFGVRESHEIKDLVIANTHCDPIRWKSGATFAGELKTIRQLVQHLQARRTLRVEVDEATGFLTHHIDLDSRGWEFSEHLACVIDAHPGARWVAPDLIFKSPS